MLFTPDAHERLTEERWEPDRVTPRSEIVEDAEEAFDGGWPTHREDIEQDTDAARRFAPSTWAERASFRPSTRCSVEGWSSCGVTTFLPRAALRADFPDADQKRSLGWARRDPTHLATALAVERERRPAPPVDRANTRDGGAS
jgi:hypothetical protein